MTKKELAYKLMFEDASQFVSKTTIKHFTGGKKKKAEAIFNECKRIERIRTPEEFDVRPTRVQKRLVFKVAGIDYNFALKQYLEQRKEKI